MIKAILLDLDDTLLHNPDAQFVPEYMRLFDTHFGQLWGVTGLAQVVRGYARTVSQPRTTGITNTRYAIDLIAQHIAHPVEKMNGDLDAFYRDTFAQLRHLVRRINGAPELVDHLLGTGRAIVIATNPLYPAEAIRHRLAWAGLPTDFNQYALVTTGDNMHFAKPDPAYYAEIVARVGVEPDEAIMVGDSLTNDIQPARTLGMNTFHVTSDEIAPEADDGGDLNTFYQRITQSDWLDRLTHVSLDPAAINPQLRGNVGALFGMLADVAPHHWSQHPDPEEWSIIQIICHLLESETAVQLPRLQRIVTEDNPFLASPRPPLGPRDAIPCDEDGSRAARRFADCRAVTLDWLAQRSTQDWLRPARHSIFGLTTLLEMAHFTAQHDRLHLNQLCQTIGRCD